MKLRMYLRGLGIGVVVTALLLGLAGRQSQKISDAEIMERASALGMVKQNSGVLSEVEKEKEEEEEEVPKEPITIEEEISEKPEEKVEEVTEKPEEDEDEVAPKKPTEKLEEVPEKTEEKKEDKSTDKTKEKTEDKSVEKPKEKTEDKPAEKPKEKTEDKPVEKPAETAVVTTGDFTLEIASGSPSERVSALLAKGGVISSAADFDKYLCSNGYDHRICAGKHIIPAGADYETIAKIITSRNR